MSTAGIIFSNVHDNHISELTSIRSIGSVPFACRYRFIDFTLSNFVNSEISNISVITSNNYMSLMDHVGSGKDWDLARRSGGLKILPPNLSARNYASSAFVSRLESLKNVYSALTRIPDETVVLADCDVICNLDIKPIIEEHLKNGADITMAVKQMNVSAEYAKNNVIIRSDDSGRMTDILTYPAHYEGEAEVCLNLLVMKTEYLLSVVSDSISRGYTSLTRDILAKNMERSNFRVYRYDGYFATISSLEDYYRYSMEVLENKAVYDALFGVKTRPVLTKIRNSAPSYFSESSDVKNSMIADGCVIEGKVENSILFRGVKVGKNTTVKNSILMQDAQVGDGAFLNCVISDKNVVIRDAVMLSGVETQPYFIGKGKLI